jgi:hypothetical protein
MADNTTNSNDTSNRGFAAMSKGKQKDIASMGGKATHGKNLSHEDRVKGGENSHKNDNA